MDLQKAIKVIPITHMVVINTTLKRANQLRAVYKSYLPTNSPTPTHS